MQPPNEQLPACVQKRFPYIWDAPPGRAVPCLPGLTGAPASGLCSGALCFLPPLTSTWAFPAGVSSALGVYRL